MPLPKPLDELDVLHRPGCTARREEGCEQLVHSPALDARDCARRRERHLDREGRERGEVVEEGDGEDRRGLDARL